MNFDKFDREFAILLNFFKKEGFHRNPTSYEKTIYAKLLSYILELRIITSRLEDGLTRFNPISRAFFQSMKGKRKPNKNLSEELVMTMATIMLDLSDFYIYSRMFLDAITISIKHSFRSAGNKNWQLMKNSVSCLLKNKQLQRYKRNIDSEFFEGLEKKVAWIHDFKKSRDKLMHLHSHLALATTMEGKLGYDVVDAGDISWGSNTVIDILQVLQKVIDNLSDLMEYLSRNLPRTP